MSLRQPSRETAVVPRHLSRCSVSRSPSVPTDAASTWVRQRFATAASAPRSIRPASTTLTRGPFAADATVPTGVRRRQCEVPRCYRGDADTLADRVATEIATASVPLALGGDHSIAIGSLRGSARDADIGVIWFDAHGDFNTPSTSPSGNVHGMPLAAALGIGDFAGVEWANAAGLKEENVAHRRRTESGC